MIILQILIRHVRLQPLAPSHSSELSLTDSEYLNMKKAEQDSIQSESPREKRLMFIPCVIIRKRVCTVISTKCNKSDNLQMKNKHMR